MREREREKEKERLRVCDHEVSESEREKNDRSVFSSSSSFASLPSSSRSEKATKCKSSHVLRTYAFCQCRNNWTNCFSW